VSWAEPVPRPRVRAPQTPEPPASRIKLAVAVVAVTVLVGAALFAWHQWELFLMRDTRFALNGPDGADDASVIQVLGAAHASRKSIQFAFADDLGRSVYLLPLADRRATLRTVDWVKDATVARVWPNRVLVSVTERHPVAFVALTPSRFGLMDEDGVILPAAADRFHLPVLRGVRSSDPLADRRDRVQRMLRVLRELGGNAEKLAEVDLTDRSSVKVAQTYDGRLLTLILGDQHYALRYRNFLNHYAEIREKLPGATSLDLRIEDRITVVGETQVDKTGAGNK
jgi:cell division protein FtsQ